MCESLAMSGKRKTTEIVVVSDEDNSMATNQLVVGNQSTAANQTAIAPLLTINADNYGSADPTITTITSAPVRSSLPVTVSPNNFASALISNRAERVVTTDVGGEPITAYPVFSMEAQSGLNGPFSRISLVQSSDSSLPGRPPIAPTNQTIDDNRYVSEQVLDEEMAESDGPTAPPLPTDSSSMAHIWQSLASGGQNGPTMDRNLWGITYFPQHAIHVSDAARRWGDTARARARESPTPYSRPRERPRESGRESGRETDIPFVRDSMSDRDRDRLQAERNRRSRGRAIRAERIRQMTREDRDRDVRELEVRLRLYEAFASLIEKF